MGVPKDLLASPLPRMEYYELTNENMIPKKKKILKFKLNKKIVFKFIYET